jgi:hypothetical protein
MNAEEPPHSPRSEDDPWLRHLDRWELRTMKIAVLFGVIIFVYKLLRHELESPRPETTTPSRALTPDR